MITDAYLATIGAALALATLAAPILAGRAITRSRPHWWYRTRRATRRHVRP